MVDGVSANVGVGAATTPGNGFGGALGSTSALGGTNSLVSVDAMQEFRIQTSTFAPEFGRTPGAQISILTRSGTNLFHGTAFDYLRNDLFDASNWFNGFRNNPPLPKAEERQNDFGGTFSGPIVKDRTFFFFSYEGLRLRLPQTSITSVPDLGARQNAAPAMQPFLNAFPQPNGMDDLTTGDRSVRRELFKSRDARRLQSAGRSQDQRQMVSLRPLQLFAFQIYGPWVFRGVQSLSVVQPFELTTQTATAGVTWIVSSDGGK